ncbi:hypothetical protein WDU94_000188 [Cyamophila willieti]
MTLSRCVRPTVLVCSGDDSLPLCKAYCPSSVYDISSNLSWGHLVHLVTFRKSVLVVVLYLVSLLLCLIGYKYDEMFVYLSNYPNDLAFAKNFKSNDLLTWKRFTLARCALSLLAWIILALSNPHDLLHHNLKSIKTYETTESKPESNTS